MRQFIRHPADIPIEYALEEKSGFESDTLVNVSRGGLCFTASDPSVAPGLPITVRIPVARPPFEASGVIVWCNQTDGHAEVGVQFADAATDFVLRMVEQVCHIEHYRRKAQRLEGRELTGEQAAQEWIQKHAREFPQ